MRKIRYYDIWKKKQDLLGQKEIGPIENRHLSNGASFETTLDSLCEMSIFDDQEKAYFIQKVRNRLLSLDLESEQELERINPQLCLEDSDFYLTRAVDQTIEYAYKVRLTIMKRNPKIVVIDYTRK